MFDCANVEVRELLPELVAGTLDAATRARVEEHVSTCAECASELETLRLVRKAFSGAPAIDVRRVVVALPKAAVVATATGRPGPVRRWLDWRIAAALTTITVGGLSLAVSQRLRPDNAVGPLDSMIVGRVQDAAVVDTPPTRPAAAVRTSPSMNGATRGSTTPSGASPKAQLSFGGGVGDLDEASIRALLGALDEIDRAPVAPSVEPDRTPVLPVVTKEGQR